MEDNNSLKKFIQSLPRLITDYPILVWGFQHSEDNNIESIRLGPTTKRLVGMRKGYPQYENEGHWEGERSLMTLRGGGLEIDFCLKDTLTTLSFPVELLNEFILWQDVDGDTDLLIKKYVAHAKDKLGYMEISAYNDFDLEQLVGRYLDSGAFLWRSKESRETQNFSAHDGFKLCFEAIQARLDKGMRLESWNNGPDKSFSFNRVAGTINVCNEANFEALLNEDSPLHSIESEELESVDWSGRNLQVADLRSAQLKSGNLKDTTLLGANLNGANMTKADLSGGLFDSDWDREIITNLSNANLVEANLQGASLEGTDLRNANLSNADLRKASMMGANLCRSNLEGANLEDVNLQDCIYDEATVWPKNFTPPPSGNVFPPWNTAAKQDLGTAKQDLGTEYLCFSCKTKFYDLNKPEPTCPQCKSNLCYPVDSKQTKSMFPEHVGH